MGKNTHIVNKKIIPDGNCSISEKKHSSLAAYHLKEGDVILARRGEMGRCALVTKKEDSYLCGTGSMFIRPQKNLDGLFLVHLISTEQIKRLLDDRAKGITMKNLSTGIIEKLALPIPPIEAQRDYTAIVDQVEQIRIKMKASLSENGDYFNVLMQRYFG